MPANASQNETPLSTWALDREIVLSRVINAPRELVFSAWVDPRASPPMVWSGRFQGRDKVNGYSRQRRMAVRYDRSRRQAISESDAIPAHRAAAPDRDSIMAPTKTTILAYSAPPSRSTSRATARPSSLCGSCIRRRLSATRGSDSARSNSVIRPSRNWRNTSNAVTLLKGNSCGQPATKQPDGQIT